MLSKQKGSISVKVSELERNNRAAMTAHAIEIVVMLIFCLLQVMSQKRSVALLVFDVILGAGPVATEIFFWKKDHETKMIKHLVAIGFAIYYSYTLFTCSNNLVFAFVIPMIVMITIFNDSKYSIQINSGTVILSVITVIGGAKSGLFGYEGADDAILQVVIMILVAAFSIYSATVISNHHLSALLSYLSIYFLLKNNKEDKLSNYIIAGIILGLSNVLRPEGIVIIFSYLLYRILKLTKKDILKSKKWLITVVRCSIFVCFYSLVNMGVSTYYQIELGYNGVIVMILIGKALREIYYGKS